MLHSEQASRYFVIDEDERACGNREQDRRRSGDCEGRKKIKYRRWAQGAALYTFLTLWGWRGVCSAKAFSDHVCGKQPGRDGPHGEIRLGIRIPFHETCID